MIQFHRRSVPYYLIPRKQCVYLTRRYRFPVMQSTFSKLSHNLWTEILTLLTSLSNNFDKKSLLLVKNYKNLLDTHMIIKHTVFSHDNSISLFLFQLQLLHKLRRTADRPTAEVHDLGLLSTHPMPSTSTEPESVDSTQVHDTHDVHPVPSTSQVLQNRYFHITMTLSVITESLFSFHDHFVCLGISHWSSIVSFFSSVIFIAYFIHSQANFFVSNVPLYYFSSYILLQSWLLAHQDIHSVYSNTRGASPLSLPHHRFV